MVTVSLSTLILTGLVTFLTWFTYKYWFRYGQAAFDAVKYQGPKHGRAVVVGCSIAGMGMAKVLSAYFSEVVILERDPVQAEAEIDEKRRGGVPQGPLSHLLLINGQKILAKFFGTEFDSELERLGAVPFDYASEMSMQFFSVWKKRSPPRVVELGWTASRFLFEQTIRRLLIRTTPNVKLLTNIRNIEPIFTESTPSNPRARVTGVTYLQPVKAEGATSGGAPKEVQLDCNFLVDATGRHSQIVKWLEKAKTIGARENVNVDVGTTYTSFICERGSKLFSEQFPKPDGVESLPYRTLCVYEDHTTLNNRHFLLWPIEGNRYQVVVGGLGNDTCPTRWEDAIEYAKGLTDLLPSEVMKTLTPINWRTGTSAAVAPAPKDGDAREEVKGVLMTPGPSVRKHLEKMQNFPLGLHVTGDAACCFNPIFGQGMAMALQYSIVLDRTLKEALIGLSMPIIGSPLAQSKKSISETAFLAKVQEGTDHARSLFWWTTFDAWTMSAMEDMRWSFTTGNTHPFWAWCYKIMSPIALAFQSSNGRSEFSYRYYLGLAQQTKPLIALFHPEALVMLLYHLSLDVIDKITGKNTNDGRRSSPTHVKITQAQAK